MLLFTDQISCFDEAGKEVDCLDSGHDAAYGPKERISKDRFNVSDAAVEDTWTGLTWLRNANLPEFPLSWEEAFRFVHEMNLSQHAGRANWGLPNREELFSLISHQNINPRLPLRHPFQNVFDGYYWTGTYCARLPNQAWYIHMGYARVYRGMKHCSYMVWPVAGREQIKKCVKDRFAVQEDVFMIASPKEPG